MTLASQRDKFPVYSLHEKLRSLKEVNCSNQHNIEGVLHSKKKWFGCLGS